MKKTIFKFVLAAALVANSVLAAETQQQSDMLASQVSVTRDALNQVLTKLRNAPLSQVGMNPDFVEKAQAFNKKVEAAMLHFEDRLKNDILKKAAFYVARMNSIKDSKAYSDSQKAALLSDQISLGKILFKDMSKEYQDALYELYTTDLPEVQIKFNTDKCDFKDLNEYFAAYTNVSITSSDPRLNLENTTAYDLYDGSFRPERFQWYNYDSYSDKQDCRPNKGLFNNDHRFYELFVKEARNVIFGDKIYSGCYSSSCLALYSEHRTSFINYIRNDLDNAIKFNFEQPYTYPRAVTFTLENLKLNNANIKKYFTLQEGESKGLPFEISERDLRLEKLKTALVNPRGSFFSSWDCPAKAAEIKAQLCQMDGGCLSTQEINTLTNIIRDADVYSKSARVECLNQR